MFPDPVTPAALLENFIVPSIIMMNAKICSVLVILQEPLPRNWWRILLLSLIQTVIFGFSYYLTADYQPLRMFLVILINLALYKAFFSPGWAGSFIFAALDTLIEFCVEGFCVLMMVLVIDAITWEIPWSYEISLKCILPGGLAVLAIAYMARPLGSKLKSLYQGIALTWNIKEARWMYGGLFMQMALLVAILTDFTNSPEASISLQRAGVLAVCILALILLSFFIVHQSRKMAESRMMESLGKIMSESMDHLSTAIQCQRHDFINHLQVIEALYYRGHNQELEKYFNELNGEICQISELIRIRNPVIASVLNAKLTRASARDIRMNLIISADLSGYSGQSIDIVRIISNLVDNAIEAVEGLESDERWISISLEASKALLEISVRNPANIEPETLESMFDIGYSSKPSAHSGLGLCIVQQLADKLHGQVNCLHDEQRVLCFNVVLPLA